MHFQNNPSGPKADQVECEYLRPRDVYRRFQIGQSTLYRWIREKRIKSILLRDPGCKQGTRLIEAASLREYLASFVEE